ncbi:hypothetical protein CISIN_1g038361mg [Citrus sinensis]|uniref:Uncharacterized protein n=1 Tax=Citrus sinensis TaxID=2711 RepID=A0A067ECF9_CITSI|nr:hypothetical protein CISIN_1g038361mg [Citrus sinensis]
MCSLLSLHHSLMRHKKLQREVLTNVIHFSCRFPNNPRVYANGVNFVLYHLLNKKGLERTQTPNACIFFPCILQIL